jgi:hypothetical protein
LFELENFNAELYIHDLFIIVRSSKSLFVCMDADENEENFESQLFFSGSDQYRNKRRKHPVKLRKICMYFTSVNMVAMRIPVVMDDLELNLHPDRTCDMN